MTTIAYRDGTMAGDRRETWESDGGGTHYQDYCQKILKFPDIEAIIAMCGESFSSMVAIDWWVDTQRVEHHEIEKPDLRGDEEFTILMLTTEGLFTMDAYLRPVELELPPGGYFAMGSGRKVAFGAMWAGATAEQAIEAACAFDPYTGGNIESARLIDLEEDEE